MKSLTTNLLIAAAALAAAAGSAAAQTYTAEMPMAFRVGKTVMEPGSYEFKVLARQTGAVIVSVHNRESDATVSLIPFNGSDAPKAWREKAAPIISLKCAARTCTLDRMWNASDNFTYQFRAEKLPEGERVALLTVTMTRTD